MKKYRLLFLGTRSEPSKSPSIFQEKFFCLSREFSGDIITPIVTDDDLKVKSLGNFNIHPFPYHRGNGIVRNLLMFVFTVHKALKIYYFDKKKYDVILSPNPLVSGLTAIIIGWLTGAKVILEINGNFESAFRFDEAPQDSNSLIKTISLIKEIISSFIILFTIRNASMIKLLYKDQINPLNIKNRERIKIASFHDFTPIYLFAEHEKKDGKYILLLGYPWYLKGVDLLIQAFNNICDQIPDYRLKIVGWCPYGKEYFEGLTQGNDRIELCDPVYYDKVLDLMCECSLLVLASRTEAMGRVLLEAMASRKPVVASNVGGIPAVVKHEFNGLLFEKENVEQLAACMKRVLTEQDFQKQLVDNGFVFVQEVLSEDSYLRHFSKMITATMNG